MNIKEFIESNNGPSGKMYNEKYVKQNFPDIYEQVINYNNDVLEHLPYKEKVYHYIHDLKENIKCKRDGCDNLVKFKNSNFGYYDYCSTSCISRDSKIKELKEKNSLEKFGTKAPAMNVEIKNKMIKTNIEKYGHNCPIQNDNIKNKSKETLLKNYGVDNPNKSPDIILKRVKSYSDNLKKKYLRIYENIGLKDIDYEKKKMYFTCDKGHDFEIDLDLFHNRKRTQTFLCTICNPIDFHISGQEILLQDFIKSNYNNEISFNNRETLKPYEIDVYIPELKLAFEFNGLFYHCEKNVENNYHVKKTELAESKGIKMIQIYEDDWLHKQEIVKSRILNLLGKSDKIYARNCDLKEISDNFIVRDFLDKNHIQGFIGSKIKIGLFYKNELVSLMTFGNLRKSMGSNNKIGTYEMLRLCTKLGINVIGGASKLFKYFIKKYDPKSIISYADRSWSNGDIYRKLGFSLIGKTQPNYYYIINKERRYRFLFRKDILIKQGFDKNKTEKEIMLERKIYRIYDSGHLKFVYKKKEL